MSPEYSQRLTKTLKDLSASRIQKWLNTEDGIKRQWTDASGKRRWQRLPKEFYSRLNETERKDLVARLNHEDWRLKQALDRYEIQSAFIPPKILSEYERFLHRESGGQNATARFRDLKNHCLTYFLPKSPNPVEWQRDLQEGWVDHLIEQDYSDSTYKHIKIAMNMFMKFLAKKKPDLPYLQFQGLSPHQIREVRYKRELKGLGLRRYIPANEYNVIYDAADDRLKPYIAIAYAYGLRRNEILALKTEHIKNSSLSVEVQIRDGQIRKPKYHKTRKVSHWFMKPKDLHGHISRLQPIADTELSRAFTDLTKSLHQKGKISARYVLHDCRHSFVSNAVGSQTVHEVMFAAGHADLRTTSTYLKDTRTKDDDVYDPTGS